MLLHNIHMATHLSAEPPAPQKVGQRGPSGTRCWTGHPWKGPDTLCLRGSSLSCARWGQTPPTPRSSWHCHRGPQGAAGQLGQAEVAVERGLEDSLPLLASPARASGLCASPQLSLEGSSGPMPASSSQGVPRHQQLWALSGHRCSAPPSILHELRWLLLLHQPPQPSA